ncbi:MAG: acetyl-CoA hydrolase [Proteobacteria bacterium]|nr:acetyl-CoA hydrolase [Pseudomonadota bacterium]
MENNGLTEQLDTVEECVEKTIARVGNKLVLGAPLGLGKPVQLINAFYRHVASDPSLSLHIYTALSLELPKPGSHIEASLAGPIVERLFGDYEELDYMKALRSGSMPPNIEVSEFYFKAGAMKNIPSAQQHYISSNYTHVARDLADCGVNVLIQLVATKDEGGVKRISLSSNPDTALDLSARLRAEADRECVCIAQSHDDLPFMQHDAAVEDGFFDMLVCNARYNKTLFAVPNAVVPVKDYATALHASSLIADGGTLQIGIGSLGDAVAHACVLRHKHNARYLEMLSGLTHQANPIAEDCKTFNEGLYVSTEMFVNGMMHLMEQGVVKRKVYDNLSLQKGINAGEIEPTVNTRLFDYTLREKLIPQVLDDASLADLKSWGIIEESVLLKGAQLVIDGRECANNTSDPGTVKALLEGTDGKPLKRGKILHGGFFLGPQDFYQKLRDLDEAAHQQICMTSVSKTNHLLADVELYCAQRQKARFINTGMMVTLTGAVASDALENGSVVSGVGGQYNFVAMAHDLPGARSILCIRSTRGSGKSLKSNIVPFYGHLTIPKHLRDVIVTEYGVADLRGQCDAEIIKRLISIADSRFQQELVDFAKANGKLESEYEIPVEARNNTPETLMRVLGSELGAGLLPDYPFGTQLTEQEITLAASLRRVKALTDEPKSLIKAALKALIHNTDQEAARPFLERIDLEHPNTSKDFLIKQLVLLDLEERGMLKAG